MNISTLGISSVEMRYRAYAVALLLGLFVQTAGAQDRILVGVISPIDGKSAVGVDHEETARFAFDKNTVVTTGELAYPLEVLYANDQGVEANAVDEARALVNAGVVAILGPVDSSSTLAVLQAGLGVPVISALSSATKLTEPNRDKWFFRMTLNDKARMRVYASTLRDHRPEYIAEAPLILYDDSAEYGKGLKTDLAAALEIGDQSTRPWSAVAGIVNVTPRPDSIFVLGSGAKAVDVARQVGDHLGVAQGAPGFPRFLFVGDDANLRQGAPHGSVTIGEPTIVDNSARLSHRAVASGIRGSRQVAATAADHDLRGCELRHTRGAERRDRCEPEHDSASRRFPGPAA